MLKLISKMAMSEDEAVLLAMLMQTIWEADLMDRSPVDHDLA